MGQMTTPALRARVGRRVSGGQTVRYRLLGTAPPHLEGNRVPETVSPDSRPAVRGATEEPTFARTVAEAYRMACSPNCELLRPMLIELKRQYPIPTSVPTRSQS